MANVVGEAGIQAIRDFIKPLVIETTDVLNTSDVFNVWDFEISAILFGYTNLNYEWQFNGAKLTELLNWNFIEVHECTGHIIILHKVGERTYEGMRRSTANYYDGWKYVLKIPTGTITNSTSVTYSCFVWVEAYMTPFDQGTGVPYFALTSLFDFSQAEINTLFAGLVGANSFVFTKTQSNYSVPIGVDLRTFYIQMPLDTNGTAAGTVRFNFIDSAVTNSGLVPYSIMWEGHSNFFNRYQTWYFQLSWDANNNESGTMVLINNQAIAIQTISASDYASLSTKDPNVLYFVPEE